MYRGLNVCVCVRVVITTYIGRNIVSQVTLRQPNPAGVLCLIFVCKSAGLFIFGGLLLLFARVQTLHLSVTNNRAKHPTALDCFRQPLSDTWMLQRPEGTLTLNSGAFLPLHIPPISRSHSLQGISTVKPSQTGGKGGPSLA